MARTLSDMVLPRRPMARRREESARTPMPPPAPARRAEQVEPDLEPEAAASEASEADTEEDDSVETAIDERLAGLDGKAREQVMRRVIAAYAENDVAVLDLLEEEAAMAREQAS